MGTLGGTCEIVEVQEELNMNDRVRKHHMSRQGRVHSIEDDINQLFDSVKLKSSIKGKSTGKNPMKQPIRPSSPQPYGIGFSESVNLKQALRGLCISQASEVAAMKMRSLKSAGSTRVSEVGVMNTVTKTVVADGKGSILSQNDSNCSLQEISHPGNVVANLSETAPDSVEHSASSLLKQGHYPCTSFAQTLSTMTKMEVVPSQGQIVPMTSDVICDISKAEQVQKRNLKLKDSLQGIHTIKNVLEVDDMGLSKADNDDIVELNREPYPSSIRPEEKTKNSRSISPCLMKPVLRYKRFINRKGKTEPFSDVPSTKSIGNTTSSLSNKQSPVSVRHADKTHDKNTTFNSEKAHKESGAGVVVAGRSDGGPSNVVAKANGRLRPKEKAEFSQSSLSSNGEYSSSTSEESSGSGSSRSCTRPHMSKDMRWEAVHCVVQQEGFLSLRHFKLLRRLGSGDIGTVYLAELVGTHCLFALKAMDNEFLARRKKLTRAETERDILQLLDHPFLPTLFAHFTTEKLSCLVMEYCPGGDLHVIRQKQPSRCFSEQAARFYVAEVLLALEYLHMLGVVYRDLKPENILVREDGHIMLSDFDLSLRCIVNPTLLASSSPTTDPAKKVSSGSCSESTCIDPFCIQPSWQVSCFTPRLLTTPSRSRRIKAEQAAQATLLPQLVAEPTDARSNSFVGTHEYLAPEIIKGEGHGSAVDWWTFGIFLYELLYGKTPFKGSSNEETLANVVSQPLKFPEIPLVSFHAKDLIRGLLVKQPESRLGFIKGAAEIKQHQFFEGLNWALIRCAVPPERPKNCDVGGDQPDKRLNKKPPRSASSENIEFELF